jgi:MFS family permease
MRSGWIVVVREGAVDEPTSASSQRVVGCRRLDHRSLVVCNGPVGLFTFGVLLKPITEEFGWDRGTMSAASGMASLMIAVGVPVGGMLVDRWGVRRTLLPSSCSFRFALLQFR